MADRTLARNEAGEKGGKGEVAILPHSPVPFLSFLRPRCWFWCSAALLLLPVPAAAHNLFVFAHADGENIAGRAYFQGNIAARQADVIARDSAGHELGRTKTDEDGAFTLPAGAKVDYYLSAETTDGHASRPFVVSAAELPDHVPVESAALAKQSQTSVAASPPREPLVESRTEPVSSGDELKALKKQIELLRSQLDQTEHRLQVRDFLGGIGYILGVAGLGFYMKARGRNAATTSRNPS